MQPGARVSAAIELLETLHDSWEKGLRLPTDAALSDYYKKRRYMGSKDRAFVAELIYTTLRRGGALQYYAESSPVRDVTPRQIVLLGLVLGMGHSPAKVAEWCDGRHYSPKPLVKEEQEMLEQSESASLESPLLPDWARYNMQDWLVDRLRREYGENFAAEIDALSVEAPVDLRVNTLKCPDRSELIFTLDKHGYTGTPTPISPLGVRLKKRLPIYALDIFKDGWFEMQDEGSQLLATLIEARPGQKVIDFCAGAGGKTLAIAAAMENKGRLLAWDVNEKRLNQIRKRLARAGVDNVLTHVLKSETDPFLKRHIGSADWVLVDAPCSGTGTWRRNPDLKWRFTETDLAELKALQASILKNAARLVAPGGILVYATCSLLTEENEQQVASFLVEHPNFTVEPPGELWNNFNHKDRNAAGFIRLSPHRHGTDGFFAARLKRH